MSFGGVRAIHDLNLRTLKGQIHSIIGPNGAGKTTLLNIISGIYKPQNGTVCFGEENLLEMEPHEIVKRGIARTFQNIELFPKMTVLDNVLVGRHIHIKTNIFSSTLSSGKAKREENASRKKALDILKFLDLINYRDSLVVNLTFGQQKLVELARALATEPKMLLLDEPAGGMNIEEIEKFTNLLRILNSKWGIDVLLVEHVMRLVMNISDRITVLNFGLKIAEGPPKVIKNNHEVIKAYLGGGEE